MKKILLGLFVFTSLMPIWATFNIRSTSGEVDFVRNAKTMPFVPYKSFESLDFLDTMESNVEAFINSSQMRVDISLAPETKVMFFEALIDGINYKVIDIFDGEAKFKVDKVGDKDKFVVRINSDIILPTTGSSFKVITGDLDNYIAIGLNGVFELKSAHSTELRPISKGYSIEKNFDSYINKRYESGMDYTAGLIWEKRNKELTVANMELYLYNTFLSYAELRDEFDTLYSKLFDNMTTYTKWLSDYRKGFLNGDKSVYQEEVISKREDFVLLQQKMVNIVYTFVKFTNLRPILIQYADDSQMIDDIIRSIDTERIYTKRRIIDALSLLRVYEEIMGNEILIKN